MFWRILYRKSYERDIGGGVEIPPEEFELTCKESWESEMSLTVYWWILASMI